MRKMHIGKVIRQRRKELGYTQQKLCEGICEPPNISRLENEQQIPSRSTMSMILERLGLPNDMYIAYLSDNETEIEDLQAEIISCNMTVNSEQGLDAIERLEKIVKENDKIIKQFILRSKAILGHRVENQIVPYTESEKLKILYDAILLTSPKFDIDNLKKNLYGVIEVKIINQIAQVHSRLDEHNIAIHIYEQLFEYVRTHMDGLKEQSAILPMVSYNFARELLMHNKPKEALDIASMGREYSLKYGKYSELGGLLIVMADSLYRINLIDDSRKRFIEAYFLYRATGNYQEAEIAKQHAKETMDLEINY